MIFLRSSLSLSSNQITVSFHLSHFYDILSYIFVLRAHGIYVRESFIFAARARLFLRFFFPFPFLSYRFVPFRFRFISFRFVPFLSFLPFRSSFPSPFSPSPLIPPSPPLPPSPTLLVSFVDRLVLSRENRIFRRYGVGKEEECWGDPSKLHVSSH